MGLETWLREKLPEMMRQRMEAIEARVAAVESNLSGQKQSTYYTLIGMGAVSWAHVEIGLDYFNELALEKGGPAAATKMLPRSLDAKIDLFKEAHGWPAFEAFAVEGAAIVKELHRLKTQRHDIIHGIAVETMRNGSKRFRRHVHKGRKVREVRSVYSPNDLQALVSEIANLAELVILHTQRAIDSAKQSQR